MNKTVPTPLELPSDADDLSVKLGGKTIHLTHLTKPFWNEPLITKRDLLQYYADVHPFLLPHLQGRAMVMKRYPDGASGPYFFMKRAPEPHPSWLKTCAIKHASGSVIAFPVVQDLASLLWIINLGCIDLNPWYGRCPQFDRPDYLHFDLDPMAGVAFAQVREAALIVREALSAWRMPAYAKTTGSRGIHVYVPIQRGPKQKQVWTFAKALAMGLAAKYPRILTAQYRIEKRPPGRVLVDYNQNAWGRTLASVYSVRPRPRAPVSMPITWAEVKKDIHIDDFRLDNARQRLRRKGDLWAPLADNKNRFDLGPVL